ncbi:MAG: RluA family pseudouridine synthase [Holophagaceae bacterium]|nr:RluA family pseudouridine synthase [Holophagaceae bacterium]
MMQKGPTRQSWCFIVVPEEAGQRLDQIIPARTGLSRRKVREIIKLGGVQLNHKRIKIAGRIPDIGAKINVNLDNSLGDIPTFAPSILFEDEWILVANKPSGIPTQGTRASDKHDFFSVTQKAFANQKLYLTHRLDSGTSGILLLAKGAKAADELGRLFRNHKIKKTYLAATSRPMEPCSLDKPVGRIKDSKPARFGCEGDLVDIKSATTNFYRADSMEDTVNDAHWLIAEPLTGRTHQIRVHLAHLGYPVIGDVFYGGRPSHRLWLHAWKLELVHPLTNEALIFQSDIVPESFQPCESKQQ